MEGPGGPKLSWWERELLLHVRRVELERDGDRFWGLCWRPGRFVANYRPGTRVTVSRAVRRLERRGLALRQNRGWNDLRRKAADPAPRRMTDLSLTTEGRTLASRLLMEVGEFTAEAMATEDREHDERIAELAAAAEADWKEFMASRMSAFRGRPGGGPTLLLTLPGEPGYQPTLTTEPARLLAATAPTAVPARDDGRELTTQPGQSVSPANGETVEHAGPVAPAQTMESRDDAPSPTPKAGRAS